MDTNDLSIMAYQTLLISETITHSFTVDLGAMSGRFEDEDDYLQSMLKLVRRTKKFPTEYIEEWGLENDISPRCLKRGMAQLEEHLLKTLATPLSQRGPTRWDSL